MFKKKKVSVKIASYESGYRKIVLFRKGVQEFDRESGQYKWVSMWHSVVKYYPTCWHSLVKNNPKGGACGKKIWEESQVEDFGVVNVRTEIDRQRSKADASKHYFVMVAFAMEMEQIEEVNHLNRLSAILEATKAITTSK